MQSKVIVVGVSHHNTLGMIRCIGVAGMNVDLILIGSKNSFVAKSRYVDNVCFVDKTNDIIKILVDQYTNDDRPQVLISCTDQVATLLDNNYEILKNKFIFFNCGSAGKLTQFMDKQRQLALAQEEGIKVPLSFVYSGKIEKTLFPCIIKPLKSIKGGKKIITCKNEKELINQLACFHDTEVVVQQFIKKQYEIVLLGLSVNGLIIIPGYIQKYRDFYGGTLYSRVKSTNLLDYRLIEKCKSLIQRMSYEGLFGIELIFDGEDYYFIEVNLRNDATTYSLAVGGVNLPELFIKGKTQNFKLPNTFKIEELNSIVDFNDFKHRRSYNISALQWLRQYISSKCKYYFNLKDPLPFIFAPFKK